MNISLFFDSIRVINLPEREDRREEVRAELKKIGLDEGGGISNFSFHKATRPSSKGKFPSIGARGCFLSHLNLLKQAQIDRVKHLLVLEDDVDFKINANESMTKIIDLLETLDWDILYLGHKLSGFTNKENILEEYHGAIETTHAYAIHQDCIPKLIDFLEQVLSREPGDPLGGPMHIDGAISTFRNQNKGIKTFVLSKPICYQRPSTTDIHDSKFREANGVLKIIWNFYRATKRKVMRLI